MIALVTGANGCIGYALLRELIASGEYTEVRALVRKSSADLPPEVGRTFVGDLDDRKLLKRAVTGASVVFHCAAKVHDAAGSAEDFERVNVIGTQNLLDACDAAGGSPPRIVHFSTVAVYGESTAPEGIAEDAPVAPQTLYARSKLRAESLVSAWGAARGVPAVNLRVATVYGPRDRGNMARMLEALMRRRYLSIGGGRNRKTCANVRNVAHVARLAGRDAAAHVATARPFVVADATPYTVRELERSILKAAAGIIENSDTNARPPLPPRSIPLPIALTLARLAEGLGRFRAGRRPSITRVQVRRIVSDNVYRADTMRSLPGWDSASQATLDQGMAEALVWYRLRERR